MDDRSIISLFYYCWYWRAWSFYVRAKNIQYNEKDLLSMGCHKT